MKIRAIALTAALVFSASAFAADNPNFSDKDKSFLKDVAQGNLAEIRMGELAASKAKNPQVKAFAEMMVKDHTELLNGVKAVAAKAGVDLPDHLSAMSDATYAKLKVESGDMFDKGYVSSMVSDHHDDLVEVDKEKNSTMNPDMKKLTTKASSVISMHREKIDAIAGGMGLKQK